MNTKVTTLQSIILYLNGKEQVKNITNLELPWALNRFELDKFCSVTIINPETLVSLKVFREAKLKLKFVILLKDHEGNTLYKRKYIKFENLLANYQFELFTDQNSRVVLCLDKFKTKLLARRGYNIEGVRP